AGRILQIGPPEEIYERPASTAVAKFIGRGTFFEADISAGHASLLGQVVPVAGKVEGRGAIFVRPSQIAVSATGTPATVTAVHYRGGHWEAAARCVDAAVDVMVDLPHRAAAGDTIHLTFTGGWGLPE
ncbi:MAG: TOBE domain-containing protein, partial [Pseudomonadota bacterium]